MTPGDTRLILSAWGFSALTSVSLELAANPVANVVVSHGVSWVTGWGQLRTAVSKETHSTD